MALLRSMIRLRGKSCLSALCASAACAACALWWNAQLAGIIDAVSAGRPPSGRMLLWALVTMLCMSALGWAKAYAAGYACEGMGHDLRMGYARHFCLLPFAEAEALNAGEQQSRLQHEIAAVSDYLGANLFALFDDGMRFFTTLAWLLSLSPALTLVAYMPALALVGYVFWSSKVIGAATARSQAAKAQMNRQTDTLLTLFPIIRLYDAARMVLDAHEDAVRGWQEQAAKAEGARARLMSLSALLSTVPLLLLFLAGGRMAIRGTLRVGVMYVFLNLSGNVSGVLMNMPGYIAAFRQFAANMGRLAPYIALVGEGAPHEH